MKRTLTHRILPFLIATAVIVLPSLVTAQSTPYTGLVQCDGVLTGRPGEKKCDFVELVNQIKFLINWMFYISIPVVLCLFTWAGFLYMRATPASKEKAKGIFTNALIGFIIMLVAWFSVKLIITVLTDPEDGFGTLLGN